MDVIGRKVEGQVQFWSFLGPFFILLSISVLLFKVTPHWYFPVSALIGIPLCVKWKMKGMAAALSCLLLLSSMGYQSLELDDRYWHVGLALAMAFSFIVLTLSLEEVQAVINKMELESQSRLDNFLLLDEKWKLAEQEWNVVIEKSKSEVTTLTQEIARVQEEKQTFYKLAQLAKDELVQVRNQHDQLIQDLLYKKEQIAQLHERLEESEMTVQDFVNSDAEKQVQALQECVAKGEQEKETLRAKITRAQAHEEAYRQEKQQLQQEMEAYREQEKVALENHLKIQNLQTQYALLEEEKNGLVQAQTKLLQQVEQLEEDHQNHLQQIQKDLEEQKEIAQRMQSQNQEEQKALNKENQEKEVRCQEVLGDLSRVREELEIKQNALMNIQQQVTDLNGKLEEERTITGFDKLPYAPGNHRHIEAMYIQLKEQFQERCSILDATRRELFHANEMLLKYQKEYEEEHIFDLSSEEKSLQRHYLELGLKYEKSQDDYHQEFHELSDLVGNLLYQMARKRT